MTERSLALCLTLFLSASGCTQPPSTPANTHSNTIEFGTDEGSWISLDVAPNGEYLVFELLGDLYELPIEGGDARPIISGHGFASQPRFHPMVQPWYLSVIEVAKTICGLPTPMAAKPDN